MYLLPMAAHNHEAYQTLVKGAFFVIAAPVLLAQEVVKRLSGEQSDDEPGEGGKHVKRDSDI